MKAVFSLSWADEVSVAPAFFVLNVSFEFLRKAESLSALCTKGIVSINAESSDGEWQEGEENTFRIFGDEIVVDRLGVVSFKTYSKTFGLAYETIKVDIATIRRDFEAGEDLVFYGYSENEMRERYDEIFGLNQA